jgi:uncharacterized protein
MILILLFIGVVAGIVAGFLGVGGGLFFTPIFFLMYTQHGVENPVLWTIGTSLFCTFIASFSSTIQQIYQHNLYWSQGLKVGVLGAAGVFLGKWIVQTPVYTETVFVIFFACLLCFVAYQFFSRGAGQKVVVENPDKMDWSKAIVTGGLGGTMAAMAGIGGGTVMVPLMNLWYKIGLSRAVSISSLAIVIISLSGWIQFALLVDAGNAITSYSVGAVDFGTAFPVMIGAFAGGILGVKFNDKASDNFVQIGFSVMVLIVAGVMVYSLF